MGLHLSPNPSWRRSMTEVEVVIAIAMAQIDAPLQSLDLIVTVIVIVNHPELA